MTDDLHTPIHAICPGCGEPSLDLLAHAPYCSTPEALDLRADFEEESLAVRAAIQEIEFTLTTLPAEESAGYTSRLAELHEELQRLTASSITHCRLLDVLRERGLARRLSRPAERLPAHDDPRVTDQEPILCPDPCPA